MVDANVSALERAFQLAEAGRVATVDEIRKHLRQEGYDDGVVDSGRSLASQLRGLIKAARLGQGSPAKRVTGARRRTAP